MLMWVVSGVGWKSLHCNCNCIHLTFFIRSAPQIITHSVHWLDCYDIGIVGTRYLVMIIFFRWHCTVCRYVWSIPILRWRYFVHIICTFFWLTLLSSEYVLGAMKNNTHLLKKGALVLLPELDDGGRSIIYANPSLIGDDDPDKVRVCYVKPVLF